MVIKPECMPNFLAHDELSPGWSIVLGGVEIRIIELYRASGDVRTADPDRSYAQPAIVAIFAIAHFHSTVHGSAVLWVSQTRNDGGIEYRRDAPIARRGGKLAIPCGRHVVTKLKSERVGSARPVITTPRMIGVCDGGKHNNRQQSCCCYSREFIKTSEFKPSHKTYY